MRGACPSKISKTITEQQIYAASCTGLIATMALVSLYALLSWATVKAQLGHLIGLLSLSDSTTIGSDMPHLAFVLLDLLTVSQTSYKQVSKQLAKSMSNGKNMDNFTALYTSCLRFTFGTNLKHAFSRAFCCCTGFLLQNDAVWVPGQRRRGYYWSCADCLGQSESGSGINMQE